MISNKPNNTINHPKILLDAANKRRMPIARGANPHSLGSLTFSNFAASFIIFFGIKIIAIPLTIKTKLTNNKKKLIRTSILYILKFFYLAKWTPQLAQVISNAIRDGEKLPSAKARSLTYLCIF